MMTSEATKVAGHSEQEIQAVLTRIEACLAQERPQEAVADLQALLASAPQDPRVLCGVGRVSVQLGDNAAALQALDMALASWPDMAEARNARAVALQNLGRLAEAEAELMELTETLPDHPGILGNLGGVLAAKGDIDAAETMFRRVLELDPESATTAYNLGLLHLLRGDLAAGWRGFELRHRASNVGLAAVRSSSPRWQGEYLPGETLLVTAEQGLGDNIQFARFVPLAAKRVGCLVLETHAALEGLLRQVPGVSELVRRDAPLPAHDRHIPMMSLAKALDINDAEALWTGRWLETEVDREKFWRGRLQRAGGKRHVGLVWSGNPGHKRDRERSIPFAELAPLFSVPGVSFHSLQIGAAAAQLAESPFNRWIKPLFRREYPLTDVAAALTALDLVIGVDTALVHLAGSLQRPVWTMVTHVPDWRWGMEGEGTPWYPTMRLFRQPVAGNWSAAITSVADALRDFVAPTGG